MSKLRESPLIYANGLRQREQDEIDILEEKLHQRYNSTLTAHKGRFAQMKQGPGEDIEHYATRMLQAYNRGKAADPSLLICYFLDRVKSTIHVYVLDKEPKTFDEPILLAKKYEKKLERKDVDYVSPVGMSLKHEAKGSEVAAVLDKGGG